MELSRLLSLARLTPAQALEIGATALAEAASREETDPGDPLGDMLGVGPVLVGADGRAVLGRAADGRPRGRASAPGPTGDAVAGALADLARAARQGCRHGDPVAEQLLAALDRAASELEVAGVPAVARTLRAAAAAIDREAARSEVAALVGAVRGLGPARGSTATGALSPVSRPAPAKRARERRTRSAWRRIGAWLLSLVVLAGLVLLEVVVLRDKISADVGVLLDAGRSGSTPSATPEPDGRPIVAPAPPAAGPVTAVDLRMLATCAPGAPCAVRLQVHLVAGPDPQPVTWSYQVTDRCSGATVTAPGGTVTVPPRGEWVVAVGVVPLPAAGAVAVVAMTGQPAAAASSPVLIGTCPPVGQGK